MCICSAWKGRPRNDLYCVGCDVKPYSIKIEIDIEKLHMKFSALNVDFDGPSLDLLRSRKPAHEGIRELYSCRSCYFTVGQSLRENGCRSPLTCCLSQQALVMRFSVI